MGKGLLPVIDSITYHDCLEVRRENNHQNCSVQYCERQLCTMIRTRMRTVLKFT